MNATVDFARRTARRIARVEDSIESAILDGRVNRAEKKKIDGEISHALNGAQGLVTRQGDSAVDALEHVRKMNDRDQLVVRGDQAVAELVDGRREMVRDARHDARTNPFERFGREWRAPLPGTRTKSFSFEGKRAHIVAIDLANPNVRLETTGSGERGRTVATHARSHNAELAINGDFFTYGSYQPSGYAMKDGKAWPNAKREPSEGSLVWRRNHAEIVPHSSDVPDWAKNAVSARPVVLRDGRVVKDYSGDPSKALPTRRTGAGVSKNGRILYLVAVQDPISAKDLGRLLRKHGAYDGFSMDGGGSAQLYQRGRGLVQPSSDPGGERRVANSILVQADRRRR